MKSKVIAIVGQIASGKTTLAQFMEAHGFERIVTYTTRPPRKNETQWDGISYHFLTDNEFTEKAESGFFAETTEYNAKFGYARYGTAKESLETLNGVNKVIVLNPEGAGKLKYIGYDIFVVHLDMPQEVLMRRALQRGDSPEEVGRRVADDERLFREMESAGFVDLTISNPLLLPNQLADMIRTAL